MKTEINYLFDVDGTLTPSRGVIEPNFAKWFLNFCKRKNVILVTGSDRPKTLEQLGEDIYNSCKKVYNCSGNDVYVADNQIKYNNWKLPIEVQQWLNFKLEHSPFEIRTGLHFEHRTGMCNFSIVGRNAQTKERKKYHEYDCKTNERIKIAEAFNKKFTDLQAKVGGETGLDIFPLGCDKGQVLSDFDINTIRFFGDRCDKQGNDYPIAKNLKAYQVFAIKDWKHCWEILQNE